MANTLHAIDVLLVGGGPAGIAAAVALRRQGLRRVVLLEREDCAGGVPRHCGHPPFGMREFGRVCTGPAYARRLVDLAQAAGVELRVRTTVLGLQREATLDTVSPAGRERLHARRVILATGVRETPRAARLLSGDRPLGVMNTGALQAFVYLRGLVPFQRPLIVGTELVAISALLTCRKAGIRPVALVEAAARPITHWPCALFPRLLGIPVHYGTQLLEIRGRQRVASVLLQHADGRREEIACDGVLLTGDFVPEAALVRESHLVLDAATGGPRVDQFGRCSDPGFFAAGNLLRPIETAGWCFREGTRIGNAVADDLAGRLPPAAQQLAIACSEGIRYVMPQRISLPLSPQGLPDLQLRVDRQTRGLLSVSAQGRTIWQQRLRSLPQRRILVALPELALLKGADSLRIALSDARDGPHEALNP
ncbi:FAD-binding protein [Verminephrobacter aporrectodeae subsp. tuberculatae]|uniref:NAD(P)/FAD-dependent oxidoreductase n=1 Tax=Verminephrobacter aporrectodeae TaxID=1110389 RepID=UPI0022377CAF|nr:FAD/NAD(P)-binding oxidoreductase [Verminephrobacter aporrectodeae]MCW5221640.1 FAD-binding protein [Verminephrobacter aporrectodeae subsp. tuberculatae]MCW5290930.1 FAD-binding protein [Verminephrobacter aporrectodeae subsp. tuberculatae]